MRGNLTPLKHRPIGRLVLLSLGLAGVFGLNSILFFISEKNLDSIASSVENIQTLDHSIAADRSEIVPALNSGRQRCLDSFPKDCVSYLEAVLLIRNRSSDYVAALKADFQASDATPVIAELLALSDATDAIATNGFGLSFSKAKGIGIQSPDAYLDTVISHVGDANRADYEDKSMKLSRLSERAFSDLNIFSKTYASRLPSYATNQALTMTLFWVIATLEIFVFTLVGGISLLNARAEPSTSKELGGGSRMKKVRIDSFLSQRVSLLMLSLLVGLASIVVGQRLLALENHAITVSHCRRLNLQNIFFSNQRPADLSISSSGRREGVMLPDYCNQLLPSSVVQALKSIAADTANPVAEEDSLRIYSDELSAIENRDSELKRNLVFSLVAFNVFALAIESIVLYREARSIDREVDP